MALAKKLNLSKRKDRKCTIVDIILGHWQLLSKSGFSFDNWAMQISIITFCLLYHKFEYCVERIYRTESNMLKIPNSKEGVLIKTVK